MKRQVFVSYRRDESFGYSGRIFVRLIQHYPDRVFRDIEKIKAGGDWAHQLGREVRKSGVMLAVIGKDWLSERLHQPHDWVVFELREAERNRIPVVPVLVDDANMPKAHQLPDSIKFLTRRQALKLYESEFSSGIDKLVRLIAETPVGRSRLHRGSTTGRSWGLPLALTGVLTAFLIAIWPRPDPVPPDPDPKPLPVTSGSQSAYVRACINDASRWLGGPGSLESVDRYCRCEYDVGRSYQRAVDQCRSELQGALIPMATTECSSFTNRKRREACQCVVRTAIISMSRSELLEARRQGYNPPTSAFVEEKFRTTARSETCGELIRQANQPFFWLSR